MPLYGYARVSTTDQDLTLQETALRAAGCGVIRTEKKSGTTRKGRTELDTLLEFLREGDTLVVTRIDRLARSVGDLQDVIRALKAKGVALRATEQPINTSTAAGKAFLDMLGVFAEFETNLRRERQMEGIAAAKARGVYTGRTPTVDAAEVRRLHEVDKLRPSAIAKRLGIGRASVYRVLGPKGETVGQIAARLQAEGADPFDALTPLMRNLLHTSGIATLDQLAGASIEELRRLPPMTKVRFRAVESLHQFATERDRPSNPAEEAV